MAKNYTTVPNQKVIMVLKEPMTTDSLKMIVSMEDIYDVANILTSTGKRIDGNAILLWLYLAKNNNGYEFALSQADVEDKMNLGKSAYRSAVKTLIDCGFLVPIRENTNQYQFITNPKKEKVYNELNDKLPKQWKKNSSKKQFSVCPSKADASALQGHTRLSFKDTPVCSSRTEKEEKEEKRINNNKGTSFSQSNVISMNDMNDMNDYNSMNDDNDMNDMNNENYSNIKELMGSFSFSNEKEKQETKTSNEVLFLNKNIENKKVAAKPSIRDYGKIINSEYNGKMISKLWMKNEPQVIEDNTLSYMSKCDDLELTIEMASNIIENKIENEIAENVTLLDYMNDSCAKDRIAAKNFANFLLEGYSKEDIAEVM